MFSPYSTKTEMSLKKVEKRGVISCFGVMLMLLLMLKGETTIRAGGKLIFCEPYLLAATMPDAKTQESTYAVNTISTSPM